MNKRFIYITILRITLNAYFILLYTTSLIHKIKLFEFELYYILWILPLIIINLLDIFFLIKSLMQIPKDVDVRVFTVFLYTVCATTIGVSPFFLDYPLIFDNYNNYIRVIAGFINLATYPMAIWSLLCLKNCFSIIPEAHKVVSTGIYKFFRHPLYFCYILWEISKMLAFPNIPIIVFSSVYILLTLLRIKIEDNLLLKTFPEYKNYYESTGLLGFKFSKLFKFIAKQYNSLTSSS